MARAAAVLLLTVLCATAGHVGALRAADANRTRAVRGWNSYNGWGGAVNETVLLQVADFVQAHMLPYGYTHMVLDEGWAKKDGQILTDEFGRPAPNVDMYPSAAGGKGLKPLADALRGRGLQLGLWYMRGVPRSAAAARMPILGSQTNSTALDAVRFDKPCFWSTSCHGSSYPSAAANEYYQSVAAQLNEWGVSFVKADCFFPNMPYPGPQPYGYYDEDVIGFGEAMKGAGITVSFSPGISVTPANGTFIASHGYALAYRVSEDLWDLWTGSEDGTFPSGIRDKLQLSEKYAHLIGFNGTYPDFDMLPLGTMMHATKAKGVYGPASPTRLTRDEQTTTMTLWSVTRAPLFFGGRLPLDANDTWTLPLLTNPEVLYVHNSSTAARPLTPRGAPDNAHHAWAAVPDACPASAVGGCAAVALFNAGNATQQVVVQLDSLNLNLDLDKPADSDAAANSTDAQLQLCGRDLWTRRPLRGTPVLDVFAPKIPTHGAGMYVLWCASNCTAGDDMFAPLPPDSQRRR